MVMHALDNSIGGELFVPKIPSYRITDVAEAIGPECEQRVVGIRPGEKLHEEMITQVDSLSTIETDKYYIIVPHLPFTPMNETMEKFKQFHQGRSIEEGFSYASNTNSEWLSVEDLRGLICGLQTVGA